MIKNIFTIAITSGAMLIAASGGLRAGQQKPAASTLETNSTQCNDCHDGDNPPPAPAPSPSPAK